MDLFGKHQILERIASGPVAEVFLAKLHGVEGFEKVVAIKRIRPDLDGQTAFVEAFVDAAKKAVMLSHANVVQVFDLGQEGRSYYITMERVSGRDLDSVLRAAEAGTPVPIDLALWLAGELTKGLEHAHRRRDYDYQPLEVVHGGVSPTNVLSSNEGEVKLTDFGFGLAVRALVRASGEEHAALLERHAPYAAPELLDRSAPVDGRADLFGVGAILHRMLHGRPPAAGSGERKIPQDVADIVTRCLMPSPDDRPQSASELYEEIMRALFTSGWRPSSREWADFVAAQTSGAPVAVAEHFVEPTVDELVLIEDELTAEGLSALFEETTDPGLLKADTGEMKTATDPSSPTGRSRPRADTALARPSTRRQESAITSSAHAILVAVDGASASDQERLEQRARRWGGRVVHVPDRPPLAVFDTGSIPQRAFERAVRFAILAAEGGSPRPSVGVHMGDVGGDLIGDLITPHAEDSAVDRVTALAEAASSGDVLVSEAGPALLRRQFAWSPPFKLAAGQVAHRVAQAETTESVGRRGSGSTGSGLSPAMSTEGTSQTRRAISLVPPGREEDLAAVLRAVEPARKGHGGALVLEGPAGAGKSQLLRASQRAMASLELSWFVHRPDPADIGSSFSGARGVVAELCGFVADDGADELRAKLARLGEHGAPPEEVTAVEVAFALREPPRRGDRDAVALWSRVLGRLAQGLGQAHPVVLVVDGGQDLDAESWRVFRGLVDHLEGACALLWILTDEAPPEDLLAHESVARRHLTPLTEKGRHFVVRRVAAHCGLDSPDSSLVEALVEAVGEDPRCLEQGVRLLADLDRLDAAGVAEALPRDLGDLIAGRIEALPEEVRGILQRAAVVGRVFGEAQVARVLRERSDRVLEGLKIAVRRGVLERLDPGRLAFRSRAFQEALYRGIEAYARREVHARIALDLEGTQSEDRGRSVESLARHTALSGDTSGALGYLERVADRFLEARAPVAALGPLQEAARLLQEDSDSDLDRRIDMLLRIGDVARAARRFDEARGALAEGLELARSGRRERQVARFVLGQGQVALASARFEVAADLLDRALKLCDGLGDRALVGEIYGALGETWLKNGDLVRAVDFLGKAVRVADENGDTTRLALLLPTLATAAGGSGDSATAEHLILRALRTAESTGDDLMKAKVLKAYSQLDYFGGRLDAGLKRCVAALRIAEELGSVEDTVVLSHNAGDFCMQLGDLEGAHAFFTQSLRLCEAHGVTRTGLTNEIYLTWLEAMRHGTPPPAGKAVEVEPRLRELWSTAETLGLKWETLQARWFVARCLAARGKPNSARPLFEQVLAGARKIHLQFLVDDAQAALHELDDLEGDSTVP